MSNLERAIELYEKINYAFVAYGETPEGMIEDLKDICEELTEEELLKLDLNEQL
jgi:aspartate aminotransferase-like enzyme